MQVLTRVFEKSLTEVEMHCTQALTARVNRCTDQIVSEEVSGVFKPRATLAVAAMPPSPQRCSS
jgi:hypothetical protein